MSDPAQVPTSTYRLQLRADFGFADAAAQVDYLRDLGVSHVYLSPILAAAPGSDHGYDVVDHTSLSSDAGGRAAFDALVATLHEHRLGAVADVVPNHMSLPAPAYLNEPLWDLLRDGRDSRYAGWFDVDWEAGQDTILMPVLGEPLESVLASGAARAGPQRGPRQRRACPALLRARVPGATGHRGYAVGRARGAPVVPPRPLEGRRPQPQLPPVL